ncbi:MAG: hypothetical protein PHP35_02350 [Candidatus Colwellbacteria bacterium]|nr:hypothetical protein [Candidatus Colwellbacteria bacterium]
MSCREIGESIPLLKKYGMSISVSFSKEEMTQEYANLFRRMNFMGVPFYLWLLLPDSDGYWVSRWNTKEFDSLIDKTLIWARENGFSIPGIVIDLEPPFKKVNKKNLHPKTFAEAQESLQMTAKRLEKEGIKTLAPVMPFVTNELIKGNTFLQKRFQTPISGWRVISPMMYTTGFESMSGGIIKRRMARWYAFRALSDFVKKFGASAGASLGIIGPGKLGNEISYSFPKELQDDVGMALAAGITEISVFNLAGMVRSSNPEEWFRAVVEAKPQVPQKSLIGSIIYRLTKIF